MQRLILLCVSFFLSQSIFSQTADVDVDWGNEFKSDKKSADLEIIHTDNSGVYVKESHIVVKRLSLVGAVRESATLIKCDINLKKIYTNDFNRELRGKEFETMIFLQNRLFLLATDYSKRDGVLTLFGKEIDKKTGNQAGDWIEIANWEKEEKSDDLNYRITYNYDSSRMLLVSTLEGKSKNNYEVREYDADLKPTSKPISITNEFDRKTFELEDVLYTRSGTVAIVARLFEYVDGKKKSEKIRQFKSYSIRLYAASGKQIKEITTNISGKLMVRLKLIQHSESQLALTAFYSDHSGEAIKGVMAARINPVTGDLLNSDFREISTEVIAASNDSQENASDSVEIKKGTDVGISSAMVFRNFIYTPDNGLIVTAEKINSYTHTVTSSTSGSSGAGYSRSSNTYQTFDCDDILIFKLDEKGSIKWLKMLPKQQHESFEIGSSLRTDLGYTSVPNYYANSGINNWPFYSGFGVFEGTDKVTLVLNDNESNAEITRAGQRPTRMMYYGKSTCYAVTYDMNNGNCTRTVLFSNKDKDVPTAMPRMGKMLAEDFYMIGKQDKILGKSKVAIAKLSIK